MLIFLTETTSADFYDQLIANGKTICTAIVLGMCVIACYTDLSKGRVPNWLTFPCMIAGLLIHFIIGDWNSITFSLSESLAGLLYGGIPLVIFYFMGGLGGGDVKLFAAVGALKGPRFIGDAMLTSFLVGLALAVFHVVIRWLTYNPNPTPPKTVQYVKTRKINENDLSIEEKKARARAQRELQNASTPTPLEEASALSSEDPEAESLEKPAGSPSSSTQAESSSAKEKAQKVDAALSSDYEDQKPGIPFGFAISIGVIVTLLLNPHY
jgi:Flp pilus assembly protein protease CpaA